MQVDYVLELEHLHNTPTSVVVPPKTDDHKSQTSADENKQSMAFTRRTAGSGHFEQNQLKKNEYNSNVLLESSSTDVTNESEIIGLMLERELQQAGQSLGATPAVSHPMRSLDLMPVINDINAENRDVSDGLNMSMTADARPQFGQNAGFAKENHTPIYTNAPPAGTTTSMSTTRNTSSTTVTTTESNQRHAFLPQALHDVEADLSELTPADDAKDESTEKARNGDDEDTDNSSEETPKLAVDLSTNKIKRLHDDSTKKVFFLIA